MLHKMEQFGVALKALHSMGDEATQPNRVARFRQGQVPNGRREVGAVGVDHADEHSIPNTNALTMALAGIATD